VDFYSRGMILPTGGYKGYKLADVAKLIGDSLPGMP
jgi:hypothetical protein